MPIRLLIITMGGERQAKMVDMLEGLEDIEVGYSLGVPSRELRHRWGCLQWLHRAGLIDAEYEALHRYRDDHNGVLPEQLEEALVDLRVTPRRGVHDESLHYVTEFWQKCKGINRGRSVLACLLAHLMAMRRMVDEGWDLVLEDNVRCPSDVVKRIRNVQGALAKQEDEIHLLYYGWLGSEANFQWVNEIYLPKYDQDAVAPLPVAADIRQDDTAAGGTPLWGMYAYWLSHDAYQTILDTLSQDVGALLWRTKRARHYTVKPIDKVVPRLVVRKLGRHSALIARKPAFFRAPMLSSQIHAQWDSAFCASTALQLRRMGMEWEDLCLPIDEAAIVAHWRETQKWITLREHREMVKDEGTA